MAFARGWFSVSRATRTLWRVGRHVPRLSRLLSNERSDFNHNVTLTAAVCPEKHSVNQQTEIEALLTDYQDNGVPDERQAVEVLEELLTAAGNERIDLLNNAKFSTVFSRICDNAGAYNTSVIVDMLELLHKFSVNKQDILVPLAEELVSRFHDMSFHLRQQAVHMLVKLNLNHLHVLHESLDTGSFANALSQNAVNESTVGYTVYSLKSQTWSTELNESLQDYVLENSSKLNLRSIYQILLVMIEKKIATKDILKTFSKVVANILAQDIPVVERWEVWGSHYPQSLCNLLWAFGKVNFYDEELFLAFASLVEGEPDSVLLTPRFLSNLSWSLAKVRFYSESLMGLIADLSMRDLTKFTNQDLALLLYSFGVLNCMHLQLFNGVVEKVVDDPNHLENAKLCWIVAWVAMVLNQYPEQLLSEILTDDYLMYSSEHPSFSFTALLQLSIALNFEQPELGFGFKFDPSFVKKWGRGFLRVGSVSEDMMKLAMKQRISQYKYTSMYSPFSQNVARALKVALGSTYSYNTEALSLAGYNLDFEILFDAEHRPIPIPIQWKYRKRNILLSSVGVGREKKRRTVSTELLETLKETERETITTKPSSNVIFNMDMIPKEKLIHLASDWGQKFIVPRIPVSKKVAVEADGPWHYASNCHHVLGSTVLKHRQLKALGWEVISIPYMEWEHLATGDDHVNYLIKKLNLHTVPSF